MEEKFLSTLQEIQGDYLTYRRDKVMLDNGREATREIVLHPGAVAILAVTAQEEIILVRQYRYALARELYEIPAGKLKEGEDPLESAQRELSEETGYRASSWQLLVSSFSTPGFTNERIDIYLAEDLTEEAAHPDEDEIITAEKVPLAEVLRMIQNGEIRDSKSLIGILYYLYLHSNKNKPSQR